MADWLKTFESFVSALPQAKDKTVTPTTSTSNAEKLQKSYAETVERFFKTNDKDGNGILSPTEMENISFFGANESNRTKIVHVFNQGQGMTRLELERLFSIWDTRDEDGNLTPDGKLSFSEEEAGRQSILDKLTQGTDPEKVFAQQEARALKLGAKVSDAKMEELAALFEKHGIPKKDYTPETTETESTETGKDEKKSDGGNGFMEILKTLAPIIPPVIGLFTGKSSA